MADNGTSVDSPKKGKRRGGRRTGGGGVPAAVEGGAAGGDQMSLLTNKLMDNPDFMSALQAQLGDQLGASMADKSLFYRSLPKQCKARVRALKNLQVDSQQIECRFHKELHELECRFESEFLALYEKRKQIVTGSYEPTDEECVFDLDDEEEDDEEEQNGEEAKADGEKEKDDSDEALAKSVEQKVSLNESEYDENTKGLPQFWLTALQNVSSVAELIEECDLEILKHLDDIKCTLLADPVGFVLDFYFAENEFFTNRVLTKRYLMKIEVDAADPFSFDGGEIYRCEGCEIEWNKGKNVTVKTVKKKQKNKKQGQVRTITKQVKADSFFNFFSPPQLPENEEEEVDEEVAQIVAQDYEIGLFLKESFIPKAVLFFTGEENDEEDDDDDEYDDMEDEDYDESQDPDYKPPAGGDQPQECQQQ